MARLRLQISRMWEGASEPMRSRTDRMQVLVVGGTGPTGPHVVEGLLERDHSVTILHRGVHEHPGLVGIDHLHGDPHFRESIDTTIKDRRFDLVVAMYGRLTHLAPALRGRCGHFVAIGGAPVYRGYFPRPGYRMPIPVTEEDPIVRSAPEDDESLMFSMRLAQGEAAV